MLRGAGDDLGLVASCKPLKAYDASLKCKRLAIARVIENKGIGGPGKRGKTPRRAF